MSVGVRVFQFVLYSYRGSLRCGSSHTEIEDHLSATVSENHRRASLRDVNPELFVRFRVKDVRAEIKPSMWLFVMSAACCCWCCAQRAGQAAANRIQPRREGAAVTANWPAGGGGGADQSVTFFVRRTAASRSACSWTFDWAANRILLPTEAQDIFHLTVIHEILQAYLQVLRRLLLNLIWHRLNRLRHLPEIFFSIS